MADEGRKQDERVEELETPAAELTPQQAEAGEGGAYTLSGATTGGLTPLTTEKLVLQQPLLESPNLKGAVGPCF